MSAAGDVIRLNGRVLSVISRGNFAKKHLNLEGDIAKSEDEEPPHKNKKKKKESKKRDASQVVAQDESPTEKKAKKKKSKKHQEGEEDNFNEDESIERTSNLTKAEPTPLPIGEKSATKKKKSKNHSEVNETEEELTEGPTDLVKPEQPVSKKQKSKHHVNEEEEERSKTPQAPERTQELEKKKKKSAKTHVESESPAVVVTKMDPDAPTVTHSQRLREDTAKKPKKHRVVDPVEGEKAVQSTVPLKRDPSEVEHLRDSVPVREPSPDIFSSSSSNADEGDTNAPVLKWEA